MGYQNVATPRFYIDTLLFYRSQGIGTPRAGEDVFTLNPASGILRNFSSGGQNWLDFDFYSPTSLGAINYIAFLGHDQGNADTLTFRLSVGNTMSNLHSTNTITGYVNYLVPAGGYLNGFSIGLVDYDSATGTFTDNSADFDEQTTVNFYIQDGESASLPLFIGSASIGRVYSMPHSPDLSLTMSHSYEGIKTITTKGGSTLSNANYHKPPNWGDREAWQLGDFPYYYNGRRSWDLSFSYISDSDIEPYSYYGNKYTSDTDSSPTIEEGTDNWFQNVLYYTMGGHLPFIFSPDPSIEYYNPNSNDENGNPIPPRVPEFAICRFDMRTFKRTQISFKTYNIKIKVVESW